MAFLYRCPYYTSEDPGVVRCEAGSIKFPSRSAGLWFRKTYCGSWDFGECALAQMMNGFYEDFFKEEEDEDDGREEEGLGENEPGGADQ